MSIVLRCRCDKGLQVGDEMAGKAVRCPSCREALVIPRHVPGRGGAGAQHRCACGATYAARPADAGRCFPCGRCKCLLAVPQTRPAAAAPAPAKAEPKPPPSTPPAAPDRPRAGALTAERAAAVGIGLLLAVF